MESKCLAVLAGVSFVLMTGAAYPQEDQIPATTITSNPSSTGTEGAYSPVNSPRTERLGKRIPTQVFQRNNGYYFVPAILPDWEEYRASVMSSCANPATSEVVEQAPDPDALLADAESSVDGSDALEKIVVRLKVWLDDPALKDEVFVYLRKDLSGLRESSVNPLPYDLYRIILRIGGDARIVRVSDPEYGRYAESGFVRPVNYGWPAWEPIDLAMTCQDHYQLLGQVDSGTETTIQGELYLRGFRYSTNSIHYMAAVGVADSITRELFSEESGVVSYSGSTKTSKWSINLPVMGLFGGSGSAAGESQLSASRVVSRDVLDKAVSNAVSRTALNCEGQKGCDGAKNLILDGLTQNPLALQARRGADGAWSLFDGQTNYVTITNATQNGSFDASVSDMNKDKKTVTAGKDVTVEKATENESKMTAGGNLAWTGPVPVDADLYLVSKSDFNDYVERKVVERIPMSTDQSAYFFKMSYPALEISEGEVDRPGNEDQLAQRVSCEKGTAFVQRSVNPTRDMPKSTRVSGVEPGTLTARPGTYLIDPDVKVTSSDNGWSENRVDVAHEDVPAPHGKSVGFQSISVTFGCLRGHSPVNPRSCRASGVISALEIPLYCLPYLKDGVPEKS